MNLVLNVYKDDSFTEIKRTCEADRLRVPYRVAMYVAQTLDKAEDITDEKQILKVITSSSEQVTKIIKATFGVSESELETVDVGEMYEVVTELYGYVVEKFSALRGGGGPNMGTAAEN